MAVELDNNLGSPAFSWGDFKWCKLFIELDQEQSFCGHVLKHWWSLSDSRTKNWFLVETPIPVISIIGIYYAFVVLGYLSMRIHKPFDLRRSLIWYNLTMAVLNFYITWKLIASAINLNYNFICEPSKVNSTDNEIINLVWLHFFSKIIELMDTFFIVVRKKDRQLTFLHVYHHSSVLAFWWVVLKWVPSGSPFLIAAVNSGVHVVMYLNYSLTAARNHLAHSIWWKRYITIIQMIQFTAGMLLTGNAIAIGCAFPLWMMWANILYLLSFLVLFMLFYQNTYTKYRIKGD